MILPQYITIVTNNVHKGIEYEQWRRASIFST